ncbi:MAG: DUF3071 domain-containing protein [Candidatus Ancillula sp.]|jgi:hypothetical protein|nr:DUF3071 domain-containing protein [Candidatus Ancillula sp.]
MKELQLVEVDVKKLGLVLEDDKGQQYFVAYSKQIHAASTDLAITSSTNSRIADKTSKSSDLSPREIQQRVRSGMSAKEIADRFNVALEKVLRYSVQVEREKAIIIEQFQHLPARLEKKGLSLLEVVNEYFDENDIDRKSVKWLSLRNGRDPWIIRLYFHKGTANLHATWSWDPKELVISEDDLIAREITKYYEDAKPDEEITHLGKTPKRTPEITANEYNPKLINISNSMRLRELKKLRDELDQDLKAVHDINVQNATPEKSVAKNATKATGTPQAGTTEKISKSNVEEDKPLKPQLKVISNDENSTASTGIKADGSRDDGISGNKNKGSVVKKVEAGSNEDSASTIRDRNVTGKLRAKIGKARSQKRKNVPAWDEVMISSFEEGDDQNDDS